MIRFRGFHGRGFCRCRLRGLCPRGGFSCQTPAAACEQPVGEPEDQPEDRELDQEVEQGEDTKAHHWAAAHAEAASKTVVPTKMIKGHPAWAHPIEGM